MKNRLFILLCIVVAFCSCSKKNYLDPEVQQYAYEPFFDLFYTVDGKELNYNLFPGKKATETFTIPQFGFHEKAGEVVAQLRFEWKDRVLLCLDSTHQYFVNNHSYPISDACTFEINGWKAVSGTYSLYLDNQYIYPNGSGAYSSFTVRFNCLAVNQDGTMKEISNGQLIFKRNVVNKMSAGDFAYYIYKY